MDNLITRLTEKGWNVNRNALGTMRWISATKLYDSVVGKKDAIIYFHNGWLSAEYHSEGRNVLAGCTIEVQTDNVEMTVDDFLKTIEKYIDDSYGRRVMRVMRAGAM